MRYLFALLALAASAAFVQANGTVVSVRGAFSCQPQVQVQQVQAVPQVQYVQQVVQPQVITHTITHTVTVQPQVVQTYAVQQMAVDPCVNAFAARTYAVNSFAATGCGVHAFAVGGYGVGGFRSVGVSRFNSFSSVHVGVGGHFRSVTRVHVRGW
jgi:hypothetical protein